MFSCNRALVLSGSFFVGAAAVVIVVVQLFCVCVGAAAAAAFGIRGSTTRNR